VASAALSAVGLNAARGRFASILAVLVGSGFAGLGYQIIWTQQSATWLGHEAAAMLAVVAAFFGGIAIGAFALGKRIERSLHPARWYAACEVIIGLWSLALAGLLPRVAPAILELMGPRPPGTLQAIATFSGTFVLLAPATIAMGATLPALERLLDHLQQHTSRIATLYAGNTLGAMLGALVNAFGLIPAYGLQHSATICALVNFLCAAATLMLFGESSPRIAPASSRDHRSLRLLLLTGLLGIGYEVVIVRVLSQVAENTVYTFALALAVYLLGTSIGAAIYARMPAPIDDDERRDRLVQAVASTCLLSIATLTGAEWIRGALLTTLGVSMSAALIAEALLAAAAFLLPTMAMGALFSHLGAQARGARIDLGRALGWNTLGAALAPILFGVWLIPMLGTTRSALAIIAGYALLASPRAWKRGMQWLVLVAIVSFVAWSPPLAFTRAPEGGRIVSRTEGTLATVSIIEDADGVARLRINNRQQEGSSATVYADARQALLPVLLHSSPRHALFLGMGTGITASAATFDPRVRVDIVELLPEVVAASEYFTQPLAEEFDRSRIRVTMADARRFVRASRDRYDLIVADNFHPARSGSGTLYTLEHFRAVRERLEPDGIFCQWLPLHQLDLDTLRSITATYTNVFPDAGAILATNSLDTPVIGLVARRDGARFAGGSAPVRLDSLVRNTAGRFGIEDAYALFGSFIADAPTLRAFSHGAALNTDDHPIVIYRAPRITYVASSLPRDRLIGLIRNLHVDPNELLAASSDGSLNARLSAYWNARNRFIEAGRTVEPTNDVHLMLRRVRDPLIAVLRTSPDFRPAYDPLLQMARAISTASPQEAQALLTTLHRLQPARPEAAAELSALTAKDP
jgi:spermidine synthase